MAARHKIRQNDYLYLSGRIHAMENRLLTRERMERMLDAHSVQEAAKVLGECGYDELNAVTPTELERALAKERLKLFHELGDAAPDPGLTDVFRIPYDYHNIKVLLKSEAMGLDPSRLLVDAGRYPAAVLKAKLEEDGLDHKFSDVFRTAVTEAKEILGRTKDPQRADFLLDRAYFKELAQAAEDCGSKFLAGYVRVMIDSANLRSAVRAARMEQDGAFLDQVLLEGGNVPLAKLKEAALGGGSLSDLFRGSELYEAAQCGEEAIKGGSLTRFEKLCDDGVTHYLMQGKRVAFGEHPVIGYLYAKEAELTTIRMILTGKMAGLDSETIRERLRESYV